MSETTDIRKHKVPIYIERLGICRLIWVRKIGSDEHSYLASIETNDMGYTQWLIKIYPDGRFIPVSCALYLTMQEKAIHDALRGVVDDVVELIAAARVDNSTNNYTILLDAYYDDKLYEEFLQGEWDTALLELP
uniref:Uncharacterized protein n=1 Tax=viral metagenome TaxID=1070528 RepID=A0A6M3JYF3_9ZZZZ